TRSDRDWSSDVSSSDLSARRRIVPVDDLYVRSSPWASTTATGPSLRAAACGFRGPGRLPGHETIRATDRPRAGARAGFRGPPHRSEEHTSELQSRSDLV